MFLAAAEHYNLASAIDLWVVGHFMGIKRLMSLLRMTLFLQNQVKLVSIMLKVIGMVHLFLGRWLNTL
jgi:hypothetical protein